MRSLLVCLLLARSLFGQSIDETGPRWDSVPSIQVTGWLPQMSPKLRTGKGVTTYGDVDFAKENYIVPSATFTLPIAKIDSLRFSYFQTNSSVRSIAGQDTTVYGATFVKGDSLTSDYKLQAAKVSYEGLVYPHPPEDEKLRYKMLWEVQYVNVRGNFNSTGTDTAGNATTNFSKGSNSVVLPTLGMAIGYAASKSIHFDVRGSGFMLPHRSNIGDVEASMAVRLGAFDLVAGGRYYHFRTSPKKEEFVSASMPGAYIGLRWYFR